MDELKISLHDPRMKQAVSELKTQIRAHYPQAVFTESIGFDPAGVYLKVYADVEDLEDVLNVVLERLLVLQIEEGLPLYVLPLRTGNTVPASG